MLPAILISLGSLLIYIGITVGGWMQMTIWAGVNFLALGLAQCFRMHVLFGKRSDGTLPLWSWLAFLPLHVYTLGIWHLVRVCSREAAFKEVSGNLVIGRRLLPHEVDGHFDNYIDMTAEFQEPVAIRRNPGYICAPTLDGTCPPAAVLHEMLGKLRPGRTYVHCAQGHGRTGCAALAVLLSQGQASGVAEGIQMLQGVRPNLHLSKGQIRGMEAFLTVPAP